MPCPKLLGAALAALSLTAPLRAEEASGASMPAEISAVEQAIGPAFVACADPNNLPFSNQAREGFENRIADVIAADLAVKADQFWFAGHKSFLRRTLLDGMCDAVLSLPPGLMPPIVTTRPYYTSSFVAVTRADDSRTFASFDDPWLKDARIGLQLVGNEGATTPPAISLSERGVSEHIVGFPMWAEDGVADPQGRIIDAVADGTIDVAFVWGPFGGYFARKHDKALTVKPILADARRPDIQFVFPMAVGVRKGDILFRDRLQIALDRHATEIAGILAESGVPLLPTPISSDAAETSASELDSK